MSRRRHEDIEDDVVHEIAYPAYTNQELDEFGTWLDGFRKEVTVEDFKTKEPKVIRPINLDEAMVAFGAMSKRPYGNGFSYAIILEVMETDGYGRMKRYKQPTKYDLFNHKYNAYQERVRKVNYAKEKELEELGKMSEQLASEKHI